VARDDASVERSRITLLAGTLAVAGALAWGRRARGASPSRPPVTVYKSPT